MASVIRMFNGVPILNGTTLAFDDNENCCCVINPCAGDADCTGHAGSAGTAPSIALTIFDADYTGASITWCGKTWTQQNIKDGLTQCVCPTTYFLQKALTQTAPVTSVSGFNRESWQFAGTLGFFILRFIQHFSVVSAGYFKRQRIWRVLNAPAPTLTDKISRDVLTYQYTFTTVNSTVSAAEFTLPGMNPATNGQLATVNNYKILDAMFGNYTDTNGINWKWDRGLNWI